jgi:hypothetical protein
MSCDIYLRQKTGKKRVDTGEEITVNIREMTWLRNPFGLPMWIKANTGVDVNRVINDHAYDKSGNVDRVEFLRLVKLANEKVRALESGFFLFDLNSAQQFGVPVNHIIEIEGGEIKAQMRGYQGDSTSHFTLERYKKWTAELLEFAELLQNPEVEYYCSN